MYIYIYIYIYILIYIYIYILIYIYIYQVWFYSLRQILKRSNRSLWRTPVMIKFKFLENRERMNGINTHIYVYTHVYI
jgi:hypothetical protein